MKGWLNKCLVRALQQRVGRIARELENPFEYQHETLLNLVRQARHTEFGRLYGFDRIRTVDDFRKYVPIHDYESLKGFIFRMMEGERDVLWQGQVRWFAKSSGTTSDKSKFIPVSAQSLNTCHYRAARDVLAMYASQHPDTRIFEGKSLIMGGSTSIHRQGVSYTGDLSAVLLSNMPLAGRIFRAPSRKVALMENWEIKLQRMMEETLEANITAIAGVPTWTLVLFKKMLEKTGKSSIKQIWKNLELYIHGGISFEPYRQTFAEITGNPIHYLETYNASEGFFAFQTGFTGQDMTLMPAYGIFYEFTEPGELHKPTPRTLTLEEVQTGVDYAMIITTNGGLWRYVIGDTVKFTALNPFAIRISGRTRQFINAFGEELIVENTDKALAIACEKTNARVNEYTAGPSYLSGKAKGYHEWYVEFEVPPADLQAFTRILDDTLKQLNSDYEAKRTGDLALQLPVIHPLPEGTFYRWMQKRNKLGGQHKVPRLSNDRKYLDELTEFLKHDDKSSVYSI